MFLIEQQNYLIISNIKLNILEEKEIFLSEIILKANFYSHYVSQK